MDGVLVKQPSKEYEETMRRKTERKGVDKRHWSDISGIFLNLEPIEKGIETYTKLSEKYDLYVVSTAPWNNPSAWTDKKKWIHKYLPIASKKLFLTHNKHMIIGDYIIDDRLANGVEKFPGKHIHFGQSPFENWIKVLEYFETV